MKKFIASIISTIFFGSLVFAQLTEFSQGDILSAGAINQNFSHLQNQFSLNKKEIDWKIVSTILIGNILAMATLFFIAFVPDRITVLLALGILPYIAWAMPSNLALDVTKTPIGILAGFVLVGTNLFSGVGGPLLDIFFQRVEMTRHQVVATKAVAQFLGHVSKVIFFGGLAVTSVSEKWPDFWLLIIAMIVSVLGTTLGKKVLDRINDKTFFSWTQRIMLTVGAVMIARAIYLIYL